MNLGLDKWDLCYVIYMFLSNNPSSGDINLSNLPCLVQHLLHQNKGTAILYLFPNANFLYQSSILSAYVLLVAYIAINMDPDQTAPSLESSLLSS